MADKSIPLKEYEAALFGKFIIDVVGSYKWHTGLETDAPRAHVPRLLLREFEIANNSTFGGLLRSGRLIIGDNPYASMYVCVPTGLKLILPYFNESVWKSSITWEAVDTGGENNKDKPLLDKALTGAADWISKTVGQVSRTWQTLKTTATAGQMNNSNAIVLNTPMAWKEGEAEGLSTKFYLINTNSSKAAWYKNYNICRYFKAICLHDQMNTTRAAQPPIFEAFIPGYRYLPAAAITNVTIKQIGSVLPYHALAAKDTGAEPSFSNGRYAIEKNQFYVPDAWEIELTITPLVMASRQTEIMGLNPTRTEVAAITNTVGVALDQEEYAENFELGKQGGDNKAIYNVKNKRNLFNLENGTQQIGITDG